MTWHRELDDVLIAVEAMQNGRAKYSLPIKMLAKLCEAQQREIDSLRRRLDKCSIDAEPNT